MGRAPGPGDDDPDTAPARRLGILAQQIGRTVGADDPFFEPDAELPERPHGLGHHLVIARRTHDHAHSDRCFHLLHQSFFYRAQKRTATALYVMAVLIYPFIMYAAACRSRERTPQTHCRCGDKAPAPSRRRLRPTGPLWSKTIIAYAESGAGPEYNVTKVALSGRTRNHPRRILSTSYSQFTAANRRRKKSGGPATDVRSPRPYSEPTFSVSSCRRYRIPKCRHRKKHLHSQLRPT